MIEISLTDHIQHKDRTRTKMADVITRTSTMRWRWTGQVVRQDSTRWKKHIIEWRRQCYKRSMINTKMVGWHLTTCTEEVVWCCTGQNLVDSFGGGLRPEVNRKGPRKKCSIHIFVNLIIMYNFITQIYSPWVFCHSFISSNTFFYFSNI